MERVLCSRCVLRVIYGLRSRDKARRNLLLYVRSYCERQDRVARFEKENIVTVPNLLSVCRIALSPLTGYLVLEGTHSLALGLFTLVGLTDVLDGYIARKFKGQSSNLGSVLDPLADKVFMSVLCVSMGYAGLLPAKRSDQHPLMLTVLLVAIVLGRDALLVGASFYLRYKTLPPPFTWQRYWDIQRSTVQVTPSILGKITTALQLASAGISLCYAAVGGLELTAPLNTLWTLTGAATIASGVNYLYRMKGFKILNKPP